ncbi:uncharacterized protein LOC126355542 [Schistocerca gregaria]|uniref:uncharacterized protein LOC126355542 n=1 Tax=Schistocerca gregaria TaxID=7010 RepID=UPI00211EF40A|nr:uncharacterized protein LOC126355542 [Schistocerca gregaria]
MVCRKHGNSKDTKNASSVIGILCVMFLTNGVKGINVQHMASGLSEESCTGVDQNVSSKKDAFIKKLESQCRQQRSTSFLCSNIRLLVAITSKESICSDLIRNLEQLNHHKNFGGARSIKELPRRPARSMRYEGEKIKDQLKNNTTGTVRKLENYTTHMIASNKELVQLDNLVAKEVNIDDLLHSKNLLQGNAHSGLEKIARENEVEFEGAGDGEIIDSTEEQKLATDERRSFEVRGTEYLQIGKYNLEKETQNTDGREKNNVAGNSQNASYSVVRPVSRGSIRQRNSSSETGNEVQSGSAWRPEDWQDLLDAASRRLLPGSLPRGLLSWAGRQLLQWLERLLGNADVVQGRGKKKGSEMLMMLLVGAMKSTGIMTATYGITKLLAWKALAIGTAALTLVGTIAFKKGLGGGGGDSKEVYIYAGKTGGGGGWPSAAPWPGGGWEPSGGGGWKGAVLILGNPFISIFNQVFLPYELNAFG